MPAPAAARDALKKAAAIHAVRFVEPGMTVGLGTGSTAIHAVREIARRYDAGELPGITTFATSAEVARTAGEAGLPLLDQAGPALIDLTIDGADEVDPDKNLIKGGGGAHLRERLVAVIARELVVIVDDSKLVQQLGRAFLLPVEVVSFGLRHTTRRVAATGCEVQQRMKNGVPFVTDNGNLVLDCRYPGINDPAGLQRALDALPGVVDHGLFVGMAGRVVVGDASGSVRILP